MMPKDVATYKRQTDIVLQQIDYYKEGLTEEFGDFQTQVMPTGRVLLMPEGEPNQESWMCCYLSDETTNARLVIDDYVPELSSPEDYDPVPVPTEVPSAG
jgi:hypothetical protein